MKNAPKVKIESTIIKRIIVDDRVIYRHFFRWSERTDLNTLYITIHLKLLSGVSAGEGRYSVKLPKIKNADEFIRTSKYFYIDCEERAGRFDYQTAPLLGKKSTWRSELCSFRFEDLAAMEEKFLT
ncbi:hypothetical protein GCM10023189_43010 [Nibrella saemangeumensis]|uniref:Uncharacterized protein n=1 Tax=Nibrella saemangeumensis TaxID=1084526 RepID=A0ABP8NDJ2_9BACT